MSEYTPTDEQLTIIGHDPQENARILAGPGTGKSSTLVALVNRLLEMFPALKIRLLTFTRAASAELARRVSAHSAVTTLRPGTIHSFAISILLQNPGAGNILEPLRIADDWETAEIINPTLARRARVPVRKLERLILEMAANWESLRPGLDPRIAPEDRARFQGAWNEHRRVYGYTLLAELPYALRTSLRDHPDLVGVDFDVLIVDEYQDLNACDLEVLKLIENRGCSIVAGGDDDQSIYSFRKAAPEGIRRFLLDYPGARDYPLSIAQRCGRRIIEWARYVIEADPERPHDRRRTVCSDRAPEGTVALLSFRGHASEARGIAELVKLLIEQDSITPSDILILLRGDYNHTFSKPIKRELDNLGIRYSDPNTVDQILADPQNRYAMAVFRLALNRSDSIAWATLLKLTRGIGDTFIESIYERACAVPTQFGQALLDTYRTDFKDLPLVQSRLARDLICSTLAWIDSHQIPQGQEENWGQWIIETAQGEGRPTITEEFRDLLLRLDQLIESHESLDRYLGQITPLGKDIALARSEGVRIMTLGKAKGLTVRATIIGAVEEGVMPRPDANLAEERRLLYVGMTRAKEFLYCTWARRRRGPTARSGAPRVGLMRNHSTFLNGGPVESQGGEAFINRYGRSS